MPYNGGEAVRAFVCALDDMQNANIVYVDIKLSRVLRCLAFYKEFRGVLAYCNRGFDYQAEKRRALTEVGESPVLRLPKSAKGLVAFVASLLMEFDQDKMNIVLFASTYFPDISKQESYRTFFERVIVPFKLALVEFVVNGIAEEPEIVERTVEFASNGLSQQTEYLIVNMYEAVQTASIDDDRRADLLLMIEGFAAALDARDTLMIRAVWLGLKGALDEVDLCRKEILEIDETLRLFLVAK